MTFVEWPRKSQWACADGCKRTLIPRVMKRPPGLPQPTGGGPPSRQNGQGLLTASSHHYLKGTGTQDSDFWLLLNTVCVKCLETHEPVRSLAGGRKCWCG